MNHLSNAFMDVVKRYNDGSGCTRRQLVDRLLIAVQQIYGQDSDYDAEEFDRFLHTDPSAQYAIRQQWAKRMASAMGNDNLLDALRKVGCSAEYIECSTIGVMNGSQWVCANHAVSTRLWLEMVPAYTRVHPVGDTRVSSSERRCGEGQSFKDYLAEQMEDPEFRAAYEQISAEEDAKLATTGAGEDATPTPDG